MYCNNQRASFTAVRKTVGARLAARQKPLELGWRPASQARQAGRYGRRAGTAGRLVRRAGRYGQLVQASRLKNVLPIMCVSLNYLIISELQRDVSFLIPSRRHTFVKHY